MIKQMLRTSALAVVATAALSIGGVAGAEQAAEHSGKVEWNTPQVQGSAVVKEAPRSNEALAPRAVNKSGNSTKTVTAPE
jgi:heat shock protein HslJ